MGDENICVRNRVRTVQEVDAWIRRMPQCW